MTIVAPLVTWLFTFVAGTGHVVYPLYPVIAATALKAELDDLRPAFFDANVEPSITAKTPPPGSDIIRASSNTFYRNLAQADLAGFGLITALDLQFIDVLLAGACRPPQPGLGDAEIDRDIFSVSGVHLLALAGKADEVFVSRLNGVFGD